MERFVNLFDAAGLGLFCVGGTLKALEYGLGPLPAALLGVVTAVGGGVIRDVLAGRVPEVLRRGLYATPALLGATLIVLTDWLDFADHPAVAPVAVVAAFGLRLVALIRGWNAPVARAG